MHSTEELYELIIRLEQRVSCLETENKNLKRRPEKTKDIGFTVEDEPEITFDAWFEQILREVPDHLQLVFEKDLQTGIQTLLNKCIDETRQIPLCCFARKPNTFYIYNQQKWTIIDNKQLNKYILKICNEFIKIFSKDWYLVHEERIQESEHYMDLYLDYYQKILGGNINDQECCSRINKYLYKKVKRKI